MPITTAAARTMAKHGWFAVFVFAAIVAFFFIVVLLAYIYLCLRGILHRRHLHLASAGIALPTFVFAGEGDQVVDCSVCLSAMENGEVVRQLPACKHKFHVACIDMWLRSHSTCPVCRADTHNP